MALQLILGNSGAGKSYYIFQKIIKASMEHPEKQYLIIVPEQFTMQTQKDLVMMQDMQGRPRQCVCGRKMFRGTDGRRIPGGDRSSGGKPVPFSRTIFFCTGGIGRTIFGGG